MNPHRWAKRLNNHPASLLLIVTMTLGSPGPGALADDWKTLSVPGAWEQTGGDRFKSLDGFAWYRCFVKVPAQWKGQRLLLTAKRIDDVDEAFFNGRAVGANGSMPPDFQPPTSKVRRPCVIDPDLVRYGEWNLIAWRIYDQGDSGGIAQGPVQLMADDQAIDLSGSWEFRPGDGPGWGDWPAQPGTAAAAGAVDRYLAAVGDRRAGFRGIVAVDEATRKATVQGAIERFKGYTHPNARVDDKGQPLAPEKALATLRPADDLAIDLVAHEPQVAQPIHISFDERGRMWVVQYIQYPRPAGLEIVSYDENLRAVFDKVPPPPPRNVGPFRGRDRITIHEDRDGDGIFESVKTFLDGLNITTATARGRGGIWVLNPPYLLFYPDANNDDVPDSDPVVHLSGFGLEDTHAVANSLTWGPDGWLYGGTGSTVTARVKVHLNPRHPVVAFLGQAIWRYHPSRHVFEIFSEGGYNTFGVDFDDAGRVYSGTNAGPRAVHFVQEGYYKKSFGKHGPLTNPFTFGYLDAMPHTGDSTRLTHQFIIDGGGSLPSRYRGKILAVNALANWVIASRIEPWGSTFKSVDEAKVITSTDRWFRPVHIASGPDGAAYISDWYDARITHLDPRDNWDHDRGRIYRLRAKDSKPGYKPFDLSKRTSDELVNLLTHDNRWRRLTALRVLGDRQDKSVVPKLLAMLGLPPLPSREGQEEGPARKIAGRPEPLWALYQLGAFDEGLALSLLDHRDEFVRAWAVRLIGDQKREPAPAIVDRLAQLACKEPIASVRSQLASTAKRLPGEHGLRLARALADRDDDVGDPYIPLQVWWAVEDKAVSQRQAVALLFTGSDAWGRKLVRETLLPRLARRYASELTQENRQSLIALLKSAPGQPQRQSLISAVLESTRGRGADLSFLGGDATALRLRPYLPTTPPRDAIGAAIELLQRSPTGDPRTLEITRILGDSGDGRVPAALLTVLESSSSAQLRSAALAGLGAFDDPPIASRVIALYPRLDPPVRASALALLSARPAWAVPMLQAVAAGAIPRSDILTERVDLLRRSGDPSVAALVDKVFGKSARPTSAQKQKEIERLARMISTGKGDAAAGKGWFTALCSRCHTLNGEGASIGPDLTTAKRDDARELLLSIVDPSAGIHEDFAAYALTLADGRQLIGFVTDRQGGAMKIKDPSGAETTIGASEIRDQQALPTSIMPEGLLGALSEQQVRDLLAYLMSR